MLSITVSNFRCRLKYYLDLVVNSSDVLIVPRSNEDDAIVVLSLKEYNSLTETAYLLSTESNRKELLESIAQVDQEEKLIAYDLDSSK